MKLDEMIAVLEAAKRGEKIECTSLFSDLDLWEPVNNSRFNFDAFYYRIAPKKEMTLVDEVRKAAGANWGEANSLLVRLADRIEELEKLSEAISRDCNNTANLRNELQSDLRIANRRIEELEKVLNTPLTTDELLAEIKRRIEK